METSDNATMRPAHRDPGSALPPRQLSRRAQTLWIVGSVLLAGAMIAGSLLIETRSEPDRSEGRPTDVAAVNSVRASTAEGSRGDRENEESRSPEALDQGHIARSDPMPIDPELQMGERHAVELNEMLCAETGQNCEFAKMARRQYEERYGGL